MIEEERIEDRSGKTRDEARGEKESKVSRESTGEVMRTRAERGRGKGG